MFLVDTNVLVYAANEDAPESEACRERLEAWRVRPAPWYLTWGVVYEFLRIVTHRRVLATPWTLGEAWSFVSALIASPSLRILAETDRHQAVLAEILEEVPGVKGNLVHDAHIAAVMREHGIRQIVTRDGDFHRFPFLEVVDPLV